METNKGNNENIEFATGNVEAVPGTAGLPGQLPGEATTVSVAASATGGIGSGNFIEADVDRELFQFNIEDTPLMNLMLCSKRVKVESPEVKHFMIDQPRASFRTIEECGGKKSQVPLPLDDADSVLVNDNATLLVKGVDGYDASGKVTPGRDLMLFVTGRDAVDRYPVVRAVNGKRNNIEDENSIVPVIPAGTEVIILANSLAETQKEVEPTSVVPTPTLIYLQKRGMNQVVSDYFDSQKKNIPFSKSIIAEQAIADFKIQGNRTLWASRAGKFKVAVDKMGLQYVYTTEGIRWQIKREMTVPKVWNIEQIIALAKEFFTGEDVPRSAILLAGKNLLEAIQRVDYSKHPEIQVSTKVNSIGWTVTNFHTVFGDIEIKREPTLDRLGWSNSGALLGDNRLVHYVYCAEHTFSDRVEGQEATRSGVLIWDALALKGNCHIWLEGDGTPTAPGVYRWEMWDSEEAPDAELLQEGSRFYLLKDCPGISPLAKSGQIWEVYADGDALKWRSSASQIRSTM